MNADGSPNVLQPWTETSLIAINDWNTLRVAVNEAAFNFYINDVLVWSGSDEKFARGKVGFSFFNLASLPPVFVDWASLAELNTFPAIDEFPTAQEELNLLARKNVRGQLPAYSQGDEILFTPTAVILSTSSPTPTSSATPTLPPTPRARDFTRTGKIFQLWMKLPRKSRP